MPPRPHSTTPRRDCNGLWNQAPNKKATFAGGLSISLLPAGAACVLFTACAISPAHPSAPRRALNLSEHRPNQDAQDAQNGISSHPPTPVRRDAAFHRLGRRELDDRSVPLRYVAGKRATENDAGCHLQHSCYVPISQDARYFFCSAVRVSMFTPMPASLRRAISLSMAGGTGYTFFSSIL